MSTSCYVRNKKMIRNPQPTDMIFIDSSANDVIKDSNELHNLFITNFNCIWRCPSIEKEINHPNTPEKVKESFNFGTYFTSDTPLSHKEVKIRIGIYEIMQGNATSKDHSNDALHIFYAAHNSGYLIAVDKRIIKKRDDITEYLLKEKFGSLVILANRFIYTPDEFAKILNLK